MMDARRWKAVGRDVWEEHPDGDYLICTCNRVWEKREDGDHMIFTCTKPGARKEDARIIAAAPELIAVLRKYQDQLWPNPWQTISAIFDRHGIDL